MSQKFSKGHGLIVGVANYPRISPLPKVVLKDACDVADVLKSEVYCGYPPENVHLLLDGDATAAGIRAHLLKLATIAEPEDTVVISFSGHGGRKDRGRDAGTYLIPFDCDPESLKTTAISSNELTNLLADIKAGRLIVLLDACHSAGIGELKAISPTPELRPGFDEKTYSVLASGAGRVIMASSRSTEVSLILAGMENSLFTHYLLESLKGALPPSSGDVIRVFDVFHYVSDRVPVDAPSQHPIFKANDLENNFPVALYRGGKRASAIRTPLIESNRNISGPAKTLLARRLVDRWSELAGYFDIPFADQARFPKGQEPIQIFHWLEQRGRLGGIRDAFNFLGWDDLIEELDNHP